MAELPLVKLVLTLISGLCWTFVYIDGIRLGLRDRSYAIPFYAIALNLAWEFLHTVFGWQAGLSVQLVVNAVWFLFDLGILYTYFRFGRRYFPPSLPEAGFITWSLLGIATALLIQYAFIREFGPSVAAGYAAFLQNLLMSILFIDMLVKRGNRAGQSLGIAVSKWIGTLAPTIQFGILGDGAFPRGSFLILVAGLLCTVFDVLYIWLIPKFPPAQIWD